MAESPICVAKVLIYATSAQGLLVFDEPDFPHVPLQVPGGTVEPGEALEQAALREFREETGLKVEHGMTFVGRRDYPLTHDGRAQIHQRHYFHIALDDELPDTWQHYEQHPSNGSAPIVLRFFWLPREQVPHRLGINMGDLVHLLPS